MHESVSVKEELRTHIKTEKIIEKKLTSDDAPVRQQRRKSKKPPVEADNEVPLEDLPPPAKKVSHSIDNSNVYFNLIMRCHAF